MAATIQVVLQNDVANVGASGELVKVRPGYARNFLLPRKLAVTATAAAVNRIQHERAVALAKTEKLKKEARELATKLNGLEIKISHRAGDDGRLYGSVTTKEIEAALKGLGYDIDRRKLSLDPIKTTGTYDVALKLFSDVSATLKLTIASK